MLLNEKLSGYRLILASHSPRRRQLLAGCDLVLLRGSLQHFEDGYFAILDAVRSGRIPMAAVDAANRQFGRGRIVVASQGLAPLKMNRGHLSKNYTTDLDDILTVKV